MAKNAVSFYLRFGERKVKYRNMASDTPLAELKQIAIEDFEVQNPVIMYYDDEDEEWLQVGKRFTINDKVELKVVLCDDKGNIIDDEPETPEQKTKDENEKKQGSYDAMMMKWTTTIDTVQQANGKAQGVAFIIGMYNAAGANVDVQRMESVFEKDLSFAVIRETNLTPFELTALIDAAARVRYGLRCKYIVFYYAGHGGTDEQGKSFVCPISDNKQYVYMEADIIRKLEVLKGKCLLFFFDCCMNINTVEGQQPQQEMKAKPLHSNSFVAYATSFGDKSQGNATFGGNWTKTLCKKLTEDKDLVVIMEETAIEVQKEYGKLPERHSNLSQKVNLKATAKTGGIDPLEQPPTFKQMDFVLKNYAADYDKIGRILGLDYSTRQSIDSNNIQYLGSSKKLEAIINRWMQINPQTTWKTVIKAFKDEDMNKLAGDMEKYLKPEM